jgi:hypothetical protein
MKRRGSHPEERALARVSKDEVMGLHGSSFVGWAKRSEPATFLASEFRSWWARREERLCLTESEGRRQRRRESTI